MPVEGTKPSVASKFTPVQSKGPPVLTSAVPIHTPLVLVEPEPVMKVATAV